MLSTHQPIDLWHFELAAINPVANDSFQILALTNASTNSQNF